MAFNGDAPPSFAVYQPSTGYATQEPNPGTFDYAVHLDTVTNLTSMFADSAPFGTVEPSATSAPFGTIEPSATSAPFGTVDPSTTSAPSTMGGRRRTGAASYRASTADSDYSPSGESEVEDDNDHSYGEPQNRKKSRSVRVSHVAHPYLRPAPKPKSNKRRGTKLEIPVPVPGLTKNSRGRDVPRKTEDGFVDRPFWCRVEGCNKLFSRGEHLKRHIISIHTEARRKTSNNFPDTLLLTVHFVSLAYVCECSNDFNRRDNLFQHMRAKGCAIWYKDGVRQCKTKDDAASIKADNKDRACKQARPRS